MWSRVRGAVSVQDRANGVGLGPRWQGGAEGPSEALGGQPRPAHGVGLCLTKNVKAGRTMKTQHWPNFLFFKQ